MAATRKIPWNQLAGYFDTFTKRFRAREVVSVKRVGLRPV